MNNTRNRLLTCVITRHIVLKDSYLFRIGYEIGYVVDFHSGYYLKYNHDTNHEYIYGLFTYRSTWRNYYIADNDLSDRWSDYKLDKSDRAIDVFDFFRFLLDIMKKGEKC